MLRLVLILNPGSFDWAEKSSSDTFAQISPFLRVAKNLFLLSAPLVILSNWSSEFSLRKKVVPSKI